MKNLYAFCFLLIFFASCKKDNNGTSALISEYNCLQEHFYYYKAGKINLSNLMLQNKILIGFSNATANTDIINFINSNALLYDINSTQIRPTSDKKIVIVKLTANKSCTGLNQIISNLKMDPLVTFASYCYKGSFEFGGVNLNVMSYTDEFLLNVQDTNDLVALNQIVSQTMTVIKSQNTFSKDWFTIIATKNSTGDAREMANYFYESGNFKAVEPNFFYCADGF